ncbi:MAG: pre-peptidase C-terminal domain-containing protein, partial [Sulfurovum sp.]|nr:pre-peptidase C-terminal domain-containing protein [Sulfurovum sp.]
TTSGAEATASGNNPNDDGNNRETATSIDLNSTTSGNIETVGDVDYFTIKIPSAGTLVVKTTGFADTNGSLLDASGTEIAFNDDNNNASDHNFEISTFIQDAGTYYVKVKRSSASSTGHYTLISQFTPDDHSSIRGLATAISPNSTTSGRIGRAGDEDWFKIVIPSTGKLVVKTTGSINTNGELYKDGNRNVSDDNSGSGNNFRIEYNVMAGTYYVKVSASSTGSYSLVSEFISDDYGNTISTAATIGTTSTTSGSIEIDRDKDWFKIQIPSRGTLVVETTGSTDTNGSLYNVDGDEIASNNDSNASNHNFRIEHKVTAGIYYVKVSASSIGHYTLIPQFISDDYG